MGSGATAKRRSLELTSKFPGVEHEFIFVAACEQGLELCLKNNISAQAIISIKKGITDYYYGDKLNEMKQSMLTLESNLSASYQKKNLTDYSLGYGKTEALYSRKNKNAPNSVFPIFWWHTNKENETRNTILTRTRP